MTQKALLDLDALLFDMRTTNVGRGLKVEVHERWIAKLESALGALKAEVPVLTQRLEELAEATQESEALTEVAKTVAARRK